MPPCGVLTYQTPDGNEPATAYVAGLTGKAATRAAALILLLQERGYELKLPHSRALGGGLFELRDVGTSVRLFYMLQPGNTAVLLDGMTKKRDDIPAAMLTRLRGLQRAVKAETKKGRDHAAHDRNTRRRH